MKTTQSRLMANPNYGKYWHFRTYQLSWSEMWVFTDALRVYVMVTNSMRELDILLFWLIKLLSLLIDLTLKHKPEGTQRLEHPRKFDKWSKYFHNHDSYGPAIFTNMLGEHIRMLLWGLPAPEPRSGGGAEERRFRKKVTLLRRMSTQLFSWRILITILV